MRHFNASFAFEYLCQTHGEIFAAGTSSCPIYVSNVREVLVPKSRFCSFQHFSENFRGDAYDVAIQYRDLFALVWMTLPFWRIIKVIHNPRTNIDVMVFFCDIDSRHMFRDLWRISAGIPVWRELTQTVQSANIETIKYFKIATMYKLKKVVAQDSDGPNNSVTNPF